MQEGRNDKNKNYDQTITQKKIKKTKIEELLTELKEHAKQIETEVKDATIKI